MNYKVVVLFCLSVFLVSTVRADEIRVTVPLSEVLVTQDEQGNATFSDGDIQYVSNSGEPAIPYQIVRVLVPPNADFRTLSVSIEDESMEELAGQWEIQPIPPMSTWDGTRVIEEWAPGSAIVNGRDITVYQSDARFPDSLIAALTTAHIRQWKLVEVPLANYQYNPVTKQLFRLLSAELAITFQPDPRASETISADGIAESRVRELTINFDDIAPTYRSIAPSAPSVLPRSRYVIITTAAIQSGSRELRNFVDSKEKRGFDVEVATESSWGGGIGDTAAENIRRWLRDNYLTHNIQYVLLIGDPHPSLGDVPMKMLWPRRNQTQYRESPSDYYYADLTGNWDLDGDGFYGEGDDDFGIGGVDRYWEVLVGRIPFYSSPEGANPVSEVECPASLPSVPLVRPSTQDELDSILAKAVAYEKASRGEASWRKNVLLPMEPSDSNTPGYHLGQGIKGTVVLRKRGWRSHRIYDEDYGLIPAAQTIPTTVENVTSVWNNSEFGAVFWWTHGWSQGASGIMDLAGVKTLDDDHPVLTFQASCHNSWPEDSRNLSYSLLRNGGIATVGATRVSWYYPGQMDFSGSSSNSGMTYEYAKRLITDEMDSGQALHDVKQALYPSIWMNFTVFNLYGDPSIGLFTYELGDVLQIVNVSTNREYSLAGGNLEALPYSDRDYRIITLSPGLEEGVLVRTANNDKSVTEENHLTLGAQNDDVVLYVAYDQRGALAPPSWLEQNWSTCPESVETTDEAASPLVVFQRYVSANENITLGGNHAGGDTGARSNYFVIGKRSLIQNLNVSTDTPYDRDCAKNEAKPYVDRDYAITILSPNLQGATMIRTANDDKFVSDSHHLSFHVQRNSVLYVAYDKRAERIPSWLDNGTWILSQESISTSDAAASPLLVFEKHVASGDLVILGGNHEGGDSVARSNYFVIAAEPNVEIVGVATERGYALVRADVGQRPYIDRDYEVASISSGLEGGSLIRTANDDKFVNAKSHLVVRPRKDAVVYTMYDKRGEPPPWLENGSWIRSSETISTSDVAASPLLVWERDASAGELITLGGNHSGGDTGARSNYFLVVREK